MLSKYYNHVIPTGRQVGRVRVLHGIGCCSKSTKFSLSLLKKNVYKEHIILIINYTYSIEKMDNSLLIVSTVDTRRDVMIDLSRIMKSNLHVRINNANQ